MGELDGYSKTARQTALWHDCDFIYRDICGISEQYTVKRCFADNHDGIRGETVRGTMVNDGVYASERDYDSSQCIFRSKIYEP